MVKNGHITGINLDLTSKPEYCDICVQAKAEHKPFPKESSDEAKEYGDKCTSDVWGPARVTSLGGAKYYSTFKDKASRETQIYFQKEKGETLNSYMKYEAWAKAHRNVDVIKIFGFDRGGEYTSNEFSEHLAKKGTVRHLTVHDSPQSNGASERINRTILNLARAMIIASGLKAYLWAEAVHHAVWLGNCTPT